MPQVLSPSALLGAMLFVVAAGVFDSDSWMHAASAGLVMDALLQRSRAGLREG
jgi:hypothetical protein